MALENLILECIRREISVTEYFYVLSEILSEMYSSRFKKDEFQIDSRDEGEGSGDDQENKLTFL